MGNNTRNAVSPGLMEWADVNSGSTVYVRDTNKYFNTPDTYVDKYGVTRDRWKSIPASALRSLVEFYTGGSTKSNRDAKGGFDADKKYMAVNDLFRKYMEFEGIGIKTATLLCIAIKNELPDLRHIYSSDVHRRILVEYDNFPEPRTSQVSTIITKDNARRTALWLARRALATLDLKNKPSPEEIADIAIREHTVELQWPTRNGSTIPVVIDETMYQTEMELKEMFTEEVPCLVSNPPDEYTVAGMSEDQLEAFNGIIYCPKKVMCLQGKPGSGKSHLITALVRHYQQEYGTTPLVTSYMNKACLNLFQRMPNYRFDEFYDNPGVPTIHSLYYTLALRKEEQRIFHTDLIIVDESSVLSSDLIHKLLFIHSYCPESRILFVGDENQLPPVCAYGTPFHNMMRRPDVSKFILTGFHRSNGEGIFRLMTALSESNGNVTVPSSSDVRITKAEDINGACQIATLMAAAHKDDMEQFAVIAETNELVRELAICLAVGHMGVPKDKLRLDLRPVKVSGKSEKKEFLVPNRKGMRVMCKDNISANKYFSGRLVKNEFGEIESYGIDKVTVKMDIGHRTVEVNSLEKFHEAFTQGYCSTVHKFQGSEADEVMYVMENSANLHGGIFFSQKELKFVGLTRAKKKIDILPIEHGISGTLAHPKWEKSKEVVLKTVPLDKAIMCF